MREIVTDELTGVVTLRDGEGNERIVKDGESVEEVAAAFFPPYVPPVPQSVTMRQARLALLAVGKLAQVSGIIAGLPSPQREAAQIEWEYATEVARNSPLVAILIVPLEMTEEQADDLFRLAASM